MQIISVEPLVGHSYRRFSRPEQRDGDSLRRQTESRDRFCERHNIKLSEQTYDDFGVPAFRGKHRKVGALSGFLEGIKAKRIRSGEALVIEDIDRLTREPFMDAVTLVFDILKAGVGIGVVRYDTVIWENTLNRDIHIVYVMVGSIIRANEESETKRIRGCEVREDKRQKLAQGVKFTTLGPGWLAWDEAKKEFVEIKDRVDAVRLIFKLAAQGLSQNLICKELRAKGFKPFNSAEWRSGYISKLLSNEAVLGTFSPNRRDGEKRWATGQRVFHYYPAIISQTLFDEVQAKRMPKNSRAGRVGPTKANLFTRICDCRSCGGRLNYKPVDDKRRGRRYAYLRCSNPDCDLPAFKYEDVETAILSSVREIDVSEILAPDETVQTELHAVDEEIKQARYRLPELQRKLSSLKEKLVEAQGPAAGQVMTWIDEYMAEIAAAEAQIRDLEQRRASLQFKERERAVGPRSALELVAQLEGADDDKRLLMRSQLSEVLKSFIDRIEFDPDGSYRISIFGGLRGYRFEDHKLSLFYDITPRGKSGLDYSWDARYEFGRSLA